MASTTESFASGRVTGMPSAIPRSNLVIRTKPTPPPESSVPSTRRSPTSPQNRAQPTSHGQIIKSRHSPHLEPSQLHHNHVVQPYYQSKRRPIAQKPTIAVVNAAGRQAASFIRVASAVGFNVRAQLRNVDGIVASEIAALQNVKCFIGELYTPIEPDSSPDLNGAKDVNHALIAEVFRGATLAFVNTTFWGDELAIGIALADAAKRANIQHYIYSSMPNYHLINPEWPSLPLYSAKAEIESYIRNLGLPATFVYTGIYNNNFTSLPYPLFQMELKDDGSFVWQAPFNKNVKLPWLDAEHDVGPAILQLFKDGISKWKNQRIALAFEMLTPLEACAAFARGVERPCRYIQGPIELKVSVPKGYTDQLDAITKLYAIGALDGSKQPAYFGLPELEKSCPYEAQQLWEGYRSLEEYAREAFKIEEANNGLTWMDTPLLEGEVVTQTDDDDDNDDDDDDDDDVLIMGGRNRRREEEWLA